MPSTIHGSAELQDWGSHNLSQTPDAVLNAENGSSLYVVGQNRLPSENKIDISTSKADHSSYGLMWDVTENQGMGLVIGNSRSGKGAAFLIPWLLTNNSNFFTLDFKGEQTWITAERRRKAFGHRTVIIDPTNEVNRAFAAKAGAPPEVITKYNPLSWIDPDSSTFHEDVAAVVEAMANDEGTDAFWSKAGRDCIIGLTGAEIEENPGTASFRAVRKVLSLSDEDFQAYCITVCQESTSWVADKLGRFKTMNPGNSSIKGTAHQQTSFMDSKELMASMETDEANWFSFAELAKPGTDVFVVCPVHNLNTFSGWMRVLLQDALNSLLRNRPSLKQPVTFLIDEAPVLGHMEVLERVSGVGAGFGINLIMVAQDLTQLQRHYAASWETFTNNAGFMAVTGANDQTTKEWVSDHLGNKTVTTTSTNYSQGTSQNQSNTGNSSGTSGGSSTSSGETAQKIKDPYQVGMMDKKNMLALLPGHKHYELRKLTYYEDARFFGKYRQDPHYSPQPQIKDRPYAEFLKLLEAYRESLKPKGLAWLLGKLFSSTHGYSANRMALLVVSGVLWLVMFYSMMVQAGNRGKNLFAFALYFAATWLVCKALNDLKSRIGFGFVALLVLIHAM